MSFIPPGWSRDQGGNKGWVSRTGGAASICLYWETRPWVGHSYITTTNVMAFDCPRRDPCRFT